MCYKARAKAIQKKYNREEQKAMKMLNRAWSKDIYFEELIRKNENLTDEEFFYLLDNASKSSCRKAEAVYKKLLDNALCLEFYDYISSPIAENLKDLQWVHSICEKNLRHTETRMTA